MQTFIPFGSSKNLKEREKKFWKVFWITFITGLVITGVFILFALNQAK